VEVAIVYFVILAAAFFFLIVRPQRRRVTLHRAFIATLDVGDEVITNGGIFGTIVGLDPDRVDLQIASGVVITVAKQALAQAAYEVPAELGDTPHNDAPAIEATDATDADDTETPDREGGA
jgi:preprotein translocase subunit YajC